ncbi:UbiX family flavin prenyltransferase [Subtercola frigoramans]|uniref:Flavin prenyltransferase UbiX n=1 Tax=Subtercola frigoramans TaxID=120298 RepID=A0ABS2L8Q1_9MICO|nr:UbiX family flavin prenyltransferase [Subtercola frigoramans]MBM7473475.1 4-hydroxy-3-polyprenylbenzoate decarboxylase [Subtercola frigoramans]
MNPPPNGTALPAALPDALPKIIVAISGASGAIYGIRLLEAMREHGLAESHLVVSRSGRATITSETDYSVRQVTELADVVYDNADMTAAIASGSFRTAGMIVAPCSMKTLSGIANSYDETLIVRAADVCLKERRTVVALLRETPLHRGHLRIMSEAAEAGALIMPPVPAFYTRPATVEDIVMHTVGRTLDLLGLEMPGASRWG